MHKKTLLCKALNIKSHMLGCQTRGRGLGNCTEVDSNNSPNESSDSSLNYGMGLRRRMGTRRGFGRMANCSWFARWRRK